MPSDEDWAGLRAYFDEIGMKAVEDVVAEGVDAETVGQQVAHFNDMLIERLKERLSGP